MSVFCLYLAFTAGSEAPLGAGESSSELPSPAGRCRLGRIAFYHVYFMEFACALFLVLYLREIAICGHVHQTYRVQLALLCMVRHDLS